MLAFLKTSPRLRTWVDCYIYVRGLDRSRSDGRVVTAPRPGGVLTINFGRPNRTQDGEATPASSLFGVQLRPRLWLADDNSHFVMVLLTPAGLAGLAPCSGKELSDLPVELNCIIGDREANDLLNIGFSSQIRISEVLDTWLLKRFAARDKAAETRMVLSACVALSKFDRVDLAAQQLGIGRRHLARTISHHLGLSPKSLIGLYRLNRSIRSIQMGVDSADGFADQAHQIREWNRRVGVTPGQYASEQRSSLVRASDSEITQTAFYL